MIRWGSCAPSETTELRIMIATRNPAKSREFREMLASDQLLWTDLSEFAGVREVEETGRTFRANACLKASDYARQTQMWALADDSGLVIDALAGRPGVASARWAMLQGTGRGDADNNATVLRQMENVAEDRRTARFVCVLALADPDGRIILTAQDAMEGRILRIPRGSNGFGYDPLFEIESLGRTSAELSPQEKHRISHRGKALRRLRQLIADALLATPLCEPQPQKVQ
jgi:non-canonical purine NTP pyrophosphatase (RdgB/HAM1 family)